MVMAVVLGAIGRPRGFEPHSLHIFFLWGLDCCKPEDISHLFQAGLRVFPLRKEGILD